MAEEFAPSVIPGLTRNPAHLPRSYSYSAGSFRAERSGAEKSVKKVILNEVKNLNQHNTHHASRITKYEYPTDGAIMTIYFERQARSKHDAKKRWWLYSIVVRDA